VLVVHSFQRHWQVRQMGWVALGLLTIVTVVVAVLSATPAGWGLPYRPVGPRLTQQAYADWLSREGRYQRLDELLLERADPITRYPPRAHPALEVGLPTPLDPTRDALQSLILSVPRAVLTHGHQFLRDWAFVNFSRWVVLTVYLGFILPLFTLSYASGAFGAEREGRTFVWLMTRPIPRSAIYLAKFLGTLPWCLLFSLGGFVVLCVAGGENGRRALQLYWPAALAATVAFASLFHLIGAVFRRPVIVCLVYVFFFELLVGTLPGSLKLMSLTFYARSLMYNGAAAAGYPVGMLGVPEAVSATTAWSVLVAATVGLTAVGTWLFARSEYRDDI
jgi:hypothetical protein